jgi:hypothetical protein
MSLDALLISSDRASVSHSASTRLPDYKLMMTPYQLVMMPANAI